MQIVKTRQGLSVVWGAMMSMLLGAVAAPLAHAQLPLSVFSATTSTVGLTDKVYPTADGAAAAYRVTVNQRGDTFWENYNYTGSVQTLVEVPAGTTTQIPILMNVKYNSGNPYIDSKGNLWLPETNGQLAFIPFVNGTYANNLDDTSAAAVPVCVLPMTTVTSPCHYTKMDTSAYNYYVQSADMVIDASNNIWLLDRSGGTFLRILEVVAGTTSTAPVTNTVITNLPYNGTPGNFVIGSNGDIYYVDRTNFYYGTVASAALNVVTGLFKNPTGVSLDSAGNLYITDTGNSRIAFVSQCWRHADAGQQLHHRECPGRWRRGARSCRKYHVLDWPWDQCIGYQHCQDDGGESQPGDYRCGKLDGCY
jgi:hypothetical protein